VHDVVSGQAVGEGLSEIVFDVTQPVTRWFGIR
jgi:hypothetical protein